MCYPCHLFPVIECVGNQLSELCTGSWWRDTQKEEEERLGHRRVILLPLLVYTDGTLLDKFGKRSAKPIMISLGNFSQRKVRMDCAKRLLGFFPEIPFTEEQLNANKKNEAFATQVHSMVISSLVSRVNEIYNGGGVKMDILDEEWSLIPVIPFLITDTQEAQTQKGCHHGWNSQQPCHCCHCSFEDMNKPRYLWTR